MVVSGEQQRESAIGTRVSILPHTPFPTRGHITFSRVPCARDLGKVIGKDSDAGRGWGQEEKGTTEDEMAAWHH